MLPAEIPASHMYIFGYLGWKLFDLSSFHERKIYEDVDMIGAS